MNIMKKRNIFLGLVLMLGLTGCYDLDKMPEGVLSTTIPFASTGEMRNYLDQFYQTGNYKYHYVYLPRQYIVHHRHQNLAHAFHHQS